MRCRCINSRSICKGRNAAGVDFLGKTFLDLRSLERGAIESVRVLSLLECLGKGREESTGCWNSMALECKYRHAVLLPHLFTKSLCLENNIATRLRAKKPYSAVWEWLGVNDSYRLVKKWYNFVRHLFIRSPWNEDKHWKLKQRTWAWISLGKKFMVSF